MGKNSSIGWTDHTWNGWIGCQKVSSACEFCYAESYANTYFPGLWGPQETSERRRTSESNWKKPMQWNNQAAKAGKRFRVFAFSLGDVFEDNPALVEARNDFWHIVSQTPYLDWQILTKRPENIYDMIPWQWRGEKCPKNIWWMTTTEDQATYDKRYPELRKIKRITGNIIGVSMEPLCEAVDLKRHGDFPDWVIVGGWSGPIDKIKRLNMGDVKRIKLQLPMSTAFFFKQFGSIMARDLKLGNLDPRGEDPSNLPEEYNWAKVQQFPFLQQKMTLF